MSGFTALHVSNTNKCAHDELPVYLHRMMHRNKKKPKNMMNCNLCSCTHFRKKVLEVKLNSNREGGEETIRCWSDRWLVILEQLLSLFSDLSRPPPAVAQTYDWLETVCCFFVHVHRQLHLGSLHAFLFFSLLMKLVSLWLWHGKSCCLVEMWKLILMLLLASRGHRS